MQPFSQIPSLWIALFIILGAFVESSLKIRIDAILLCCASIASLTGCLAHHSFKTVCAFFIGMFIVSELEALYPPSQHTLHVSMRCIIKGRVEESRSINDSSQICIVKGYIDAQELPRIENCIIQVFIHGKQSALHPGMLIQCQSILSNPCHPTLPGEFNEYSFAKSRHIQWFARAKSFAIIDRGLDSYQHFIYGIRCNIIQAIRELVPRESQELSISLLLGERSGLSHELRNSFALLGTAHILSVSGFHAGIIALLLQIILAWIPFPFIRVCILCGALSAFLCIIEWDPPAMRACIMVAFSSISWANQRMIHPLHGLLLTVCMMICIDPILMTSIGFQMSAMGMLGLILFNKHFTIIHDRLFGNTSSLSRSISSSLSVSLSASCTLLPLTAWYFTMISLVSPIANILLLPICTIALCWIIASLLVFPCSIVTAKLFGLAAHQSLTLMIDIHQLVSSWNWIAYTDQFAVIMAFAIIACIFAVYRTKRIASMSITVLASAIFLIGIHDVLDVIKEQTHQAGIEIIERDELLILIVHAKRESILLMDRDVHHRFYADKSLIAFLSQYASLHDMYVSGVIAAQCASTLKKGKPSIRIMGLDRSTMKKCYRIGRLLTISGT